MKTRFFVLALTGIFFVFSCKKSNSGSGNSSGNKTDTVNLVSSITYYYPGDSTRIIDSLKYDSAHLIAQFNSYAYDSSSDGQQLSVDSGWQTVQFTLPASGNAPTGYLYNNSLNNQVQQHQLSYDGNGRITRDTTSDGSGYVQYFGYSSGYITSLLLPEGTNDYYELDSLFLTNGNVTTAALYEGQGQDQGTVWGGNLTYTYSGIVNPLYNSAVSGSIGPLLYNLETQADGNGLFDPISKNVFTQAYLAGTSISFATTTDSKGRLSTVSYGLGTNTAVVITYRYY